ncbi:MAG: crossover junction endodeoxyribonuclease RuvC [Planctomycetota bacterium]|nr:crossover junction endodeoxyribonuclease RuvC [Planctomycetota bacterium]
MRVLGLDPGLRITGYACIAPGARTLTLIEAGVIRLAPSSGPARPVSHRLAELDRDLRDLLARVQPDLVAVEGLFAHPAHPATAIAMAHARGVILLAVAQSAIPLAELKPAAVKKALTGSGRADKPQMQRAIQHAFDLAEPPEPPDVADALAIAYAALHRAPVT